MNVGNWWDETDVLSYLQVEPEYSEESYSYDYTVQCHGVRLDLTIVPYEAYASFSISAGEPLAPLLQLSISQCGGIRYINDKRGEYLEFAPSRDGSFPQTVRLIVRPRIRLEVIEPLKR